MKVRIILCIVLLVLWQNQLKSQASFTKLDIATGSSSANPRKFIEYNGLLYFTAFGSNVSGVGEELFVTNGTQAGTQLVNNINPSFGASSTPENLTVFNNELYFSAFTNTNGRELYKTNGTTVTLLKDIAVGTDDGIQNTAFIELNGMLYFFARENSGLGYDLWRTDGTTNGTIKMVTLNSNSVAGNKLYFKKYNNELYFLAQSINDITVGIELYKYNAVSNTVSLVIDVFPTNGQTSSIGYSYFTVFDNKLFFVADGKLRYTNGTTTSIVNAGTTSITAYAKLKVFQNQLIVLCNSTTNGSQDIYKCTFDNTINDYRIDLVYNFVQTANLPFASSLTDDGFDVFTELDNKLYFAAREASSPNAGVVYQIYSTNGTTTNVAVPINYTGSPSVRNIYFITVFNGKLYYQSSGTNSPEQLWEANPTTGVYTQLTNFTPQANVPEQVFNRPMFVYNNELYFEAQKSGDGYELWKLNNTTLPSVCNYFNATINNGSVLLQWQIAQQTNTKEFSVELSFNGVDYIRVGTIMAAGTVVASTNYSFTHKLLNEPLLYYRVKQIDKDGTEMFLCNTVTLKNKARVKVMSLYPNAANNLVTVDTDEFFVNGTISIINLDGKVVHQQKYTSAKTVVNISSLSTGVYMIKVQKDYVTQTNKLIIQH